MPQVGWFWKGKQYSQAEFLAKAMLYEADFPYTPEMIEGMFQVGYLSP